LRGGYIAVELGQAITRLGSRVTIVERGPQLARREDPDLGEACFNYFGTNASRCYCARDYLIDDHSNKILGFTAFAARR
jgi:pyruvate/2-oxoglutarate dehydrogenase complex dihydrolipoamide dehydrogenase (E3) component